MAKSDIWDRKLLPNWEVASVLGGTTILKYRRADIFGFYVETSDNGEPWYPMCGNDRMAHRGPSFMTAKAAAKWVDTILDMTIPMIMTSVIAPPSIPFIRSKN